MLTNNAEKKYTDFQIPDYHKTKLKIYNWKESVGKEKKKKTRFFHAVLVCNPTDINKCVHE